MQYIIILSFLPDFVNKKIQNSSSAPLACCCYFFAPALLYGT